VIGFLLDTNIVSEFARTGTPDPGVKSWIATAAPPSLYVRVLTLAEILRAIERREPGKRRTQLERWLREELIPSFEPENILPVTQAIADRWAIFSARADEPWNPASDH
jgi:predicted nucleic acid-binding protein